MTDTKYDGSGNRFQDPIVYQEFSKRPFHKIRKKITNFTPKKKKRK